MKDTLQQYPIDFYKYYGYNEKLDPDLGEHVICLGKVQRHFEEELVVDYYDKKVIDFLHTKGESESDYDDYIIVPKNLDHVHTALRRFNSPPDPFTSEVKSLYSEAAKWMYEEFYPFMSQSKIKSYCFLTDYHFNGKKSPGYPWNLKYPTKNDYWNSDDSIFFDEYWHRLGTDDPIMSLFAVSIKEEMRKRAKVEKGGIRTIIASDVNHTVAMGALFLDQNEKMNKSHLRHSSAIGVSMMYGGWDNVVRRMNRIDDELCVFELDGVKFDAKFFNIHFQHIKEFRTLCLDDSEKTTENLKRVHNVYENFKYMLWVSVDGKVYLVRVGNPSGQGCTTNDNTLKNYMDNAVLFMLLTPAFLHSHKLFQMFVILVLVGDDDSMSVDKRIRHLYNPTRIMAIAHKIHMEYTTPCYEPRRMVDTEFLGHGFLPIKYRGFTVYVPSIDCHKMRASLVMFNKSHTLVETINRLCGFRNETWACKSCRKWFSECAQYVRNQCVDGDPAIDTAWKGYLSDLELAEIFTGYKFTISDLSKL